MRPRARFVAEGAKPPLRLRVALSGLALGLGIYLIMRRVYWLLSPMSFESYEIAVIVLNLPAVARIVATILGAWIAIWRSTAHT